jgi:hypothetical protein
MISINRSSQIFWVGLMILISTASVGYSQSPHKRTLLSFSVDQNTAIRFFYQPADGDYFHFPLIFRSVGQDDSRFNTAPMAAEGRVAYVSLSDMQQLLKALDQSELSWRRSGNFEAFESFKKLELTDNMEITVVSSNETLNASLNPRKICETLQPMDSALKTPRALWEFEGFRMNYGCRVPNFARGAYPEH